MDANLVNISYIRGIGPKTMHELEKAGIKTIRDLFLYYPRRYQLYIPTDIYHVLDYDKACFAGTITSALKLHQHSLNLSSITFNLNVKGENIRVIVFNRRYLLKLIKAGSKVMVSGKYNYFRREIAAQAIFPNETSNYCEAFYSAKEISAKTIYSSVYKAYQMGFRVKEYLPTYLLKKHHLNDINSLLLTIHHPNSFADIDMINERRKYEEILNFFIRLYYFTSLEKSYARSPINYDIKLVKDFIKTIPFELSVDQKKVCNEIFTDFKKPLPMNRLIMGDVGSGKTIVSVIAGFAMFTAKKQTALMAPTEILAKQHYDTFSQLLSPFGVRIVLYTKSVSAKNRNIILKDLRNGQIDIIIGTHALLYGQVDYFDLGLFIIDEQHRFGVDARSKLLAANPSADAMYLSATPIPRTLGLTIFSDLNISQINSKRANKKEVITRLIDLNDMTEMLERLKIEIANNHQAYFVVSSIDSTINENRFDIDDIKNLITQFNPNYRILSLHGKMKDEQKNQIMSAFISKEADILISTTVIEVGISVDNATMMVVLDAQNFGLATLHQLRGRVGRGSLNGYCFLVANETDKERLKLLEKSDDGFYLAEQDLKMRGPGDYFGMRQSGDLGFLFANINQDEDLFVKAKEEVNSLFLMRDNDPEIKEYLDYVIASINLKEKLN